MGLQVLFENIFKQVSCGFFELTFGSLFSHFSGKLRHAFLHALHIDLGFQEGSADRNRKGEFDTAVRLLEISKILFHIVIVF